MTLAPSRSSHIVIGRPPRTTIAVHRVASSNSQPDFSDFWTYADKVASRVPELGTLKSEIERAIVRHVLAGAEDASLEAAVLRAVREAQRVLHDGIGARVLWWGCNLEIPSTVLEQLVADVDYSVSTLQAIARAMPILELWLPSLGELFDDYGALMLRIDEGRGIYINMPWSVPGRWLPSPVV